MGKLLHASRSGYFPFCIESGNELGPQDFGIASPISLEDAMTIYWRIKSLSYSFSLFAEYSFLLAFPNLSSPDPGYPITIVNTVNISSGGTMRRQPDISGNEISLVCYNSSYLSWVSDSFEGTATEEDITTPEGPYSYPILSPLGLLIQFLGFPSNSTQTIKRTPNNLYACGVRFDPRLQSFIPTGTLTTSENLLDHNFECGTFSSPFFGSTPLYWSIDGLDTDQLSFISGSASGELSVGEPEYIDWS